MSQPARALPPAAPAAPTRTRPRPAPARRPPRPAPAPKTRGRRKAKRFPLAFVVLASSIVGLMVLGIVSLSALLAQNEFRLEALSQRIDGLSQQNGRLAQEVAKLSAPGRVADWAQAHGMRLPDGIQILHVQGSRNAAPAGGPDTSEGHP